VSWDKPAYPAKERKGSVVASIFAPLVTHLTTAVYQVSSIEQRERKASVLDGMQQINTTTQLVHLRLDVKGKELLSSAT
jgi:hypothetical protein